MVQFDFPDATHLSKEETGKNYDTAGELAQHYNSWLVAPFFERAFTESQGFQQLKQEIKERFHQQGLEVSEVRLQLPIQNPDFEDQLARDLLVAEKIGETDLRGILTLDYATYRQIKGFSFTVTVTFLAKEFEGKHLDVSVFLLGTMGLNRIPKMKDLITLRSIKKFLIVSSFFLDRSIKCVIIDHVLNSLSISPKIKI